MMFLFVLLLPSVFAISFPTTSKDMYANENIEQLYSRFTAHFGKEHSEMRLAIFRDRVESIFKFNEEGTRTYTKGISFFTDLTVEERKHDRVMGETKSRARKGGEMGGITSDRRIPGQKPVLFPREKYLANAGDGTTCELRQFQTPVKDQGSCGSCWAFGTIAAAESSHFLWSTVNQNGVPAVSNDIQMSEQVLIDCCNDEEYDSNACGGGGVEGPASCATTIGGLPSNIARPYLSGESGNPANYVNASCSYKRSEASGYVETWFMPCDSGDEVCLRTLIGGDTCESFKAIAIKTSIQVQDSFRDYTSGVYSDPTCPTDKHNHAVAIVGSGHDADANMDYWLVRNSWGPEWGDGGYIKMQRGVNMCCIACENLIFQ